MSVLHRSVSDIHVPISIQPNTFFEDILRLLSVIRSDWPKKDIKYKMFTDGITNKLVACHLEGCEDNYILVRIYGNKTDLLIDRQAELRNMKILNKHGLAPQIYGVFQNGIAYEYTPGVTLNIDSVLIPLIYKKVAQRMAKMHKTNLGDEVPKEAILWDKMEQFLCLLPEPFSGLQKQQRFMKTFGSVTKLRIEYERIKIHFTNTTSPIVFAHNDLLLGNVIYNEAEGKITFIDYEYAAYNYQAYDIANHFNEFVGLCVNDIDYNRYPNKEYQAGWIRIYLEEYLEVQPSEDLICNLLQQVNSFSLASHFFWGIWSLIQYEHSSIDFDFHRYAEIRLRRYYELKNSFFKE